MSSVFCFCRGNEQCEKSSQSAMGSLLTDSRIDLTFHSATVRRSEGNAGANEALRVEFSTFLKLYRGAPRKPLFQNRTSRKPADNLYQSKTLGNPTDNLYQCRTSQISILKYSLCWNPALVSITFLIKFYLSIPVSWILFICSKIDFLTETLR